MSASDLFSVSMNAAAFAFDADPLGNRGQQELTRDELAARPDGGSGRQTMAGRVAAYFRARPSVWIDGRDLMAVAGSYGWRTRCSDIRRPPYSMTIENRQRRVGSYVVSEYRYVPVEDLGGAA